MAEGKTHQVTDTATTETVAERRPAWFNQVYRKMEKEKDNWFKKLAQRRLQQSSADSQKKAG
jgi:hypothetical protein